MKKVILILGIILVIIILLVAVFIVIAPNSSNEAGPDPVPIDLNQVLKDEKEHGCNSKKGETWCEIQNRCLIIWEEDCK